MSIRLYNTLTREKEDFVPQDRERVTMYVCGPTVYNFAHIGNARPAVVFDVLYRLLRRRYPRVDYARNITDVDDKINKAALDQGVPIGAITERFTAAYHEDMAALGVLPPSIEPKVTEHIAQIIAMIEELIAGGHAYEVEGHVLFNVPSFERYGRLSRRDREDMIAGARVEVAPYKRDPADFVLWKPSTPELPGWESPWGRGRPGWHVECSAMVEAHLGETIDIHGGGLDLVFPHHENEIAQSTCAHGGKTYARYWLHNGFLSIEKEKMSKSLGNVLLVRELLDQAPGEALRLALLNAHYRRPLDWSEETVAQSLRMLDRLYNTLEALEDVEPDASENEARLAPLVEALEDDLNVPKALAEVFAYCKAANSTQDPAQRAKLKAALLAGGELLGILREEPSAWFARRGREAGVDEARIEALVEERQQARAARDFKRADEIRDELAALGVTLKDGPEGTTWRLGC